MNTDRLNRRNEKGAALVTVVLISVLLLTACIALLHAVGANSANSADVLSETKAYYAAETGLQATINELRYDCSAEATPDHNHDRLHFVLIEIATKWAQGFVAQVDNSHTEFAA